MCALRAAKNVGQHIDDNFYIMPAGTAAPLLLIPKN
jgi:hypothetical protein